MLTEHESREVCTAAGAGYLRQVYTERRKTFDADVAHRRNLMPRCVIITMRQIYVSGAGIQS